ncbi:MAG: ATP-dependent RNA helicase RhlE [Alphaproteobacteria bacterium MarineAlpha11_Bin1]|nr:MAG: ATP-dependent RNA helicase RhlE [Alphaproteobacteria bacterium MarineAlpha11_Bin1]|tara:strand:+ start:12021 stop:13295 length:1275 start_codon:yes stop_codon:yes gene_type:complete
MDLGLADPILRALEARNHVTPTPVQAQAIPGLMKGNDMLGIAQTGTGKTGAFALPILQRFCNSGDTLKRGRPQALVLAPTRELAIQIGEEFTAYAAQMKLRQTVIFGGVKENRQISALKRGLDVVIATPGRLLDLYGRKFVDLSGIEYFVLDEADRMLDMGFVRDVRKIVAALPADRQSLLFSATMPDQIANLAEEILKKPLRVEVTPRATPVKRVQQSVRHVTAGGGKTNALRDIFADPDLSKVIVFTRTKHRANRVAEQLERMGIAAAAIHGNKSQPARQRALRQFRAGECRVLVATDIAARGIDIEAVTHVINYELPDEAESYVHRIGRTARAGASGIAIALCDPSERKKLRDIERLLKMSLTIVGDGPKGEETAPKKRQGGKGRSDNQGRNRQGRKPANANGKPRRRGGKRGGRNRKRAA